MFLTPLDERVYLPGEWALLAPLVWRDDMVQVTVPRGFITDHASVPRPLRGLLDVNGRSREPAALHDWLYCSRAVSLLFRDRPPEETRIDRACADRLFRTALSCAGVGAVQRNVFYAGVRVGGWRYWHRRQHGLQADDFAEETFMNKAQACRPR